MIGTTLTEIRTHIESLASEDGQYYLVCGRTRDRPVPADGLYFESRTVAEKAVRATEQYRGALRRYDPRLPCYDLIVCEAGRPADCPDEPDEWTLSEPVITTPEPGQQALVEFCHRVVAAVFETLSEAGYDPIETAIMATYFELAQRHPEPDALCLRLLERTSVELSTRLTPAEQATVLADAASRLPPVEPTTEPVGATCETLQRSGVISGYSCAPRSIDRHSQERSVVVELSAYALSPADGQLPVLPVLFELYRRDLEWMPSELLVETAGKQWRITIEFANATPPETLTRIPVTESHDS